MIAALFPGQGSQEIGMGKALYEGSRAAREALDRAEAALPGLLKLMWEGPEEELKLTANQQPALLAVGYAAFQAYLEMGGALPSFAAGHSLGEWTAHVAAGTLSLEDGLRLVRKRGEYMQEAVPVGAGAMAAVLKVPAQTIQELTAGLAGVEVANYNSPEQTVISGTAEGVAKATEVLKGHKARVIPLPVSAPFHSSLMRPARERLAADLAQVELSTPRFPVYSNVRAQPETRPSVIRELLLEQITHAVRWVEILQHLKAQGVKVYLEFGSGKVLTGLVGRTLDGVEARSLTRPQEIAEYLAVLKQG
ncbi:ACP S-malonyltransferase [Meiothermus ruber]|jgi:[acyl-carrier-protein] S-malonyltransferase|uniref:Malonyl CoA-acyl carrier protein transacylase n=1 Tax=Meiothermus ruber (strain ATCC 35948 / DSM 1279 / VKM B-1258 / 21) TaxID=504728 RepID=D3PNP1_MEIRD|nr:ACP S-malonyltransferase [Meiothermus ruber]ADD27432.1 malonyl CoA-acyl carrier protein transacylase [Meiothermus ruber DSM 1279]AGK03897.1 malonyl CoA-acyl carrier protein transacylase [Meiothermus ruber DSM 1279]